MAGPKPQNIYDDPTFFDGYSRLERSTHGLDGALEWPTIQELLPPMQGLRVLDLGCGFGWFCRWATGQGATSVVGYDLSTNMLDRARTDTDDERISYQQADLDTLELTPGSADLVYSSLVLHYLTDLDRLYEQIRQALSPGGTFVFSTEHAIMTAPENPGWLETDEGKTVWPVTGYLDEGPRTTNWLAEGVVKQHRTIATHVNTLVRAGFTVTRMEEWTPTAKQLAIGPSWGIERQRPNFLLMTSERS